MLTFSERLKKCRKNLNKTQREVANELCITEAGYQNYENCRNEPKMTALIKLADYFDVSIDYLTGRTDKPKCNC